MENQILKLECYTCNKKFNCTYNTTRCPHCGARFNPDEVHELFHEYETQLANNKAYQFGNKMEKAGENINKAGEGLYNCGCGLTMLVVIVLLFGWVLFI